MKCPFCGEEMIQGKVCSSDALWWWQEGMNGYRLNDEGRKSRFYGRNIRKQ